MTTPTVLAGRHHLPLLLTLTAPLHHGAGTAGNTAILRTQRITVPDGRTVSVPLVSGNSLRHRLREALAWHLVRTLEIPDGGLTKAVVDLLFSGGALTRTGDTRLALLRRVEQLLPQLAMLGYSAGSEITGGTVAVNMLHLVCAENTWRLPPQVTGLPTAAHPAAYYRDEDFGTRHDITGSAVDRLVALAGDQPTVQMIYDFQVIRPGAKLAGSIDTTAALTPTQGATLLVALDESAPRTPAGRVITLGAKAATGYGTCMLDIDHIASPDQVTHARTWWELHLTTHRQEILDVLTEVTG